MINSEPQIIMQWDDKKFFKEVSRWNLSCHRDVKIIQSWIVILDIIYGSNSRPVHGRSSEETLKINSICLKNPKRVSKIMAEPAVDSGRKYSVNSRAKIKFNLANLG